MIYLNISPLCQMCSIIVRGFMISIRYRPISIGALIQLGHAYLELQTSGTFQKELFGKIINFLHFGRLQVLTLVFNLWSCRLKIRFIPAKKNLFWQNSKFLYEKMSFFPVSLKWVFVLLGGKKNTCIPSCTCGYK